MINCLTESGTIGNGPSQFPKVQGDVLRCLALPHQQFKPPEMMMAAYIDFFFFLFFLKLCKSLEAGTGECLAFLLEKLLHYLIDSQNSCGLIVCQSMK